MADSLDFDKLVADYYTPLYQFAFSLTRDEAMSCDLVQETFCVWANKGHQLRETSKVKSWLFTTLHREFLSLRRKESRFPQVEIGQVETELPTAAPASVNQLDTAQLLIALGKLEASFQAPVALFYLQDYSYAEIGEILEVPLGTVKSRLSRGLERLHEILTGNKTANPKTKLL